MKPIRPIYISFSTFSQLGFTAEEAAQLLKAASNQAITLEEFAQGSKELYKRLNQ